MENPHRLTGIFPVLATPLTPEERVDEAGLRRLIRHVLRAANDGIVICGSTGEFAALQYEERRKAIEIAVEEVGGKVPVIAGTGDSGTTKAVQNTRIAQQVGANAALVTLPFYYWTDVEGSITHFRAIAGETGFPVMLYNIPIFTHTAIHLEAVRVLAKEALIVGIKDAGGSFPYYQSLVQEMRQHEHFSVIQGWDSLVCSALTYGGDGAIVWSSNLVPELPVKLYQAVKQGRLEEARAIQEVMVRLGRVLEKRKSLHASLKAALHLMGISGPTLSRPITPLTLEEMKALEADLKSMGIL